MTNNNLPMLRAYGYSLRGPKGDEDGLILIPSAGLAVSGSTGGFHEQAVANSQKALEAYRRAGVAAPYRYLLFKADRTPAGAGYFCKDDGPQEMATLARVFRDVELRLAFPLPPEVK